MEQTLVLIKPDGVQRGLMGEIIGRLERRGLKIVAAKLLSVSRELAETHYSVHKGKPFYDGLITYICSAPVMALVIEGPNAIAAVRQTMGSTNPVQAAPGTVRHDLGLVTNRNLTHASDAVDTAKAEIALWFAKTELVHWSKIDEKLIFGL